jgi:hypothetical protein
MQAAQKTVAVTSKGLENPKGKERVMRDRRVTSNFLVGFLILMAGSLLGALLLLEKNGKDAVFGTGTSITTAVMAGLLLMIPGAAIILRRLQIPAWGASPARRLPHPAVLGCWLLFALALTALAFLAYISFGMTPRIPVPKSTIAWDIARPLKDYFHEGEMLGSLGFFTAEGPRDFPLLIHGPGRNLLPAWIVSHVGEAGTMVAEIRFVTSFGNFLGLSLATACAMVAALVISLRQTLVALSTAEALAYAATGALVAMTMVATVGRVTNREVMLFAVILTSLLLIWTAASGRLSLARAFAVLLGALTMLSPLHTYLGSIQSVMVASAAAVIALSLAPQDRMALFIHGVLGAGATFGIVTLLGGYWLFHDAVTTTLYWSENAEPLWGRFAPRAVLLGTLGLMTVATILGAGALAGPAAGLQDRAVRGVLALLVVITAISTYSYANLSDINHFGYGLYISSSAVAGGVTVLLLVGSKLRPVLAFVLAAVLVLPASARLLSMEGSGILRSLAQLDTPDEAILPLELYEFTTRYREELAGLDCLLVMSNDGALAYLPRLPLCGPAFNPIHLNAEGDLALATWLENNPQPLVVDGADGYGSVGGPPMRERLPRTYAVIERLYPRTERLHVWEVRLR